MGTTSCGFICGDNCMNDDIRRRKKLIDVDDKSVLISQRLTNGQVSSGTQHYVVLSGEDIKNLRWIHGTGSCSNTPLSTIHPQVVIVPSTTSSSSVPGSARQQPAGMQTGNIMIAAASTPPSTLRPISPLPTPHYTPSSVASPTPTPNLNPITNSYPHCDQGLVTHIRTHSNHSYHSYQSVQQNMSPVMSPTTPSMPTIVDEHHSSPSVKTFSLDYSHCSPRDRESRNIPPIPAGNSHSSSLKRISCILEAGQDINALSDAVDMVAQRYRSRANSIATSSVRDEDGDEDGGGNGDGNGDEEGISEDAFTSDHSDVDTELTTYRRHSRHSVASHRQILQEEARLMRRESIAMQKMMDAMDRRPGSWSPGRDPVGWSTRSLSGVSASSKRRSELLHVGQQSKWTHSEMEVEKSEMVATMAALVREHSAKSRN